MLQQRMAAEGTLRALGGRRPAYCAHGLCLTLQTVQLLPEAPDTLLTVFHSLRYWHLYRALASIKCVTACSVT